MRYPNFSAPPRIVATRVIAVTRLLLSRAVFLSRNGRIARDVALRAAAIDGISTAESEQS